MAMREKEAGRKYFVEFFSSMIFYFAMLFVSSKIAEPLANGALRTAVALLPMLGVLVIIWVVVRHMRRVDEYVRLKVLEHIACAAGITVGFAFTYTFLEDAGFPRLSMVTVWFVFGGSWAFLSCGQLLYAKLFAR
jgi:hypothetical protein